MKPHQRQAKILELLRQNGYVSVEQLSQMLNVSTMTVRRDLDQLQQINLIARHYGGASLAPERLEAGQPGSPPLPAELMVGLAPGRGDLEWPWLFRQTVHLEQKQKIGRAAASLICDDAVLLMDAGTTTLQVAKHLGQNRLTVISNFLPVLCLLSSRPNVALVGLGGVLDPENQWFTGPTLVDQIRTINANVAVMATTCLSLSKGLTNRKMDDAGIKRAMIQSAEKVMLVMDSSKMNRHTLATVAPLEAIDILVTDSGLSPEDRQAIEARDVQVVIAD